MTPHTPEEFEQRFTELTRWMDARFVGSDRVWQEKIDALSRLMHAELDAIRFITDKSDRDIRERLHDGNKIREEMREHAVDFVTRTELAALLSETFHKTIGLVSLIVTLGIVILGVLRWTYPAAP